MHREHVCKTAPLHAKKTQGGVRPVAIGACLRRLALRAGLALHKGILEEAVGEKQFACGKPGGTDALFKEVVRKVEANPGVGIVSLDLANAFGSVKRAAVQKAVRKRASTLAALTDRLLTVPTVNHYDLDSGEAVTIEQRRGLPQGCPMSGVLFGITIAGAIEGAEATMTGEALNAEVFAYADDMYIVGPVQGLQRAQEILAKELEPLGLLTRDDKTKAWVQSPQALQQLPQHLQEKVVGELPALGATLFAHDRQDPLAAVVGGGDRAMQEAAGRMKRTGVTLKKLVADGLPPQVAGAVLWYMAAGMPQHLLRMKTWSSEALQSFDAAVFAAWEGLLGMNLGSNQREIGSLPLRLGGGAFGTVQERADAAYVTGWRRDAWKRASGIGVSLPDEPLQALPHTRQQVNEAILRLHVLAPKLVGSKSVDFNAKPPADLQKVIVKEVMDHRRELLYTRLSRNQRAEHRKCGGVGSGGFMLAPAAGEEAMAAGAWRLSMRRRLLATPAALVHPSRLETQCQHHGRHGVCGEALSEDKALQHAAGCKKGGYVVEAHDAVRDVLWKYVRDRVDRHALREQR